MNRYFVHVSKGGHIVTTFCVLSESIYTVTPWVRENVDCGGVCVTLME